MNAGEQPPSIPSQPPASPPSTPHPSHSPQAPSIEPWQQSLPNALTIARVALSILLFVLLARWRPETSATGVMSAMFLAFVCFIVAAFTDALDGHLARKWKVVSAFGRVMDPFADKILVLGTLILLAGPNFHTAHWDRPLAGFVPWMVVVMLGRELLVTSIRGVLEGQGVKFAADWSGKAKMIIQSIAIPAILLLLALNPESAADPSSTTGRAITILAWATTIVTVISGWPYIQRAWGAFSGPQRA